MSNYHVANILKRSSDQQLNLSRSRKGFEIEERHYHTFIASLRLLTFSPASCRSPYLILLGHALIMG
jgi:hypothetical protein